MERRFRITRAILEVLDRVNHPVGIVTKSALVTRDIDILAQMADRQLAKVAISVTTLDPKLARRMEPRAASPAKRLETVRKLTEAGIPVTVLVAPIIPAINDHEIEAILKACAEAGAQEAGYVLLRLPHDLKDLMRDWLVEHYPDKLKHVFSLLQEARGGKDYDAEMEHPPIRRRPLCLDDRPPLRDRRRAARAQQAQPEAAHGPVQGSGEGDGAAEPVYL